MSNQDPKLVPIADNGGPTRTEAVLAGSPALGDPGTSNCPPVTSAALLARPASATSARSKRSCPGRPTASTGDATNITDTSADLDATINLHGEAGGFHFLYGTTNDPADWTASPEAAAGVRLVDTPETETLANLTPGTTYYYEAAADNATASDAARELRAVHDGARPAGVSTSTSSPSPTPRPRSTSRSTPRGPTRTTSSIRTRLELRQQTQTVDIGSSPGAQDLTATLTGLTPEASITSTWCASNGVQQASTAATASSTPTSRSPASPAAR